jgi:hypothetical protein
MMHVMMNAHAVRVVAQGQAHARQLPHRDAAGRGISMAIFHRSLSTCTAYMYTCKLLCVQH